MNARFRIAAGMTAIAALLAALTTLLVWALPAMAADTVVARAALPPEALSWGFLGAAVATGLSAIGAGIAVANVGTAAIGAIAEKPELFGRLLILVGLAEGIAIYGLIVSILILNRLA
jgi:V/A-type H+-transporting ATPase subunit K